MKYDQSHGKDPNPAENLSSNFPHCLLALRMQKYCVDLWRNPNLLNLFVSLIEQLERERKKKMLQWDGNKMWSRFGEISFPRAAYFNFVGHWGEINRTVWTWGWERNWGSLGDSNLGQTFNATGFDFPICKMGKSINSLSHRVVLKIECASHLKTSTGWDGMYPSILAQEAAIVVVVPRREGLVLCFKDSGLQPDIRRKHWRAVLAFYKYFSNCCLDKDCGRAKVAKAISCYCRNPGK